MPEFRSHAQVGRRSSGVSSHNILIATRTRPESIELAPLVHAVAGHHDLEAIVVNRVHHADKSARFGAGHAAQYVVAMQPDRMSKAAVT